MWKRGDNGVQDREIEDETTESAETRVTAERDGNETRRRDEDRVSGCEIGGRDGDGIGDYDGDGENED
jgi:hypothetical protein